MLYTVEVFRKDRRCKAGKKLIHKIDLAEVAARGCVDALVKPWLVQGYEVEVHETYVTRVNLMSGKEYQERYDTPVYCSPAFESYWSM